MAKVAAMSMTIEVTTAGAARDYARIDIEDELCDSDQSTAQIDLTLEGLRSHVEQCQRVIAALEGKVDLDDLEWDDDTQSWKVRA